MFNKNWLFTLRRLSKKLSLRAAGFGLLAIIAALIAVAFAPWVPKDWADLLGNEAVDEILKIVASSMLAVVTFSLATMVAAYASASESVTPRAAKVLMEDRRSQNALSTFLGAFIFSIVALAALSTGYYGAEGRFILFCMTVFMLIAIVWTMIGWIEELSKLGRVHETITRIEKITRESLRRRARLPSSDCQVCQEIPAEMNPLCSEKTGYVQTIDFEKLNDYGNRLGTEIYIVSQPGRFVHTKSVLMKLKSLSSPLTPAQQDSLRACFVLGDARTFEEDPRFGLIVLSEVASRALSPAVNDPGTAIDVIGSQVRLLSEWALIRRNIHPSPRWTSLWLQEISCDDFLTDAFRPLSRDGAEHIEVVIRIHKGLRALQDLEYSPLVQAARIQEEILFQRASRGLKDSVDLEVLNSLKKNEGLSL